MNDVKELYAIWLERATDDADVLRELKEMAGDEKKITDAFYRIWNSVRAASGASSEPERTE